jgi:hypothetical protein
MNVGGWDVDVDKVWGKGLVVLLRDDLHAYAHLHKSRERSSWVVEGLVHATPQMSFHSAIIFRGETRGKGTQ